MKTPVAKLLVIVALLGSGISHGQTVPGTAIPYTQISTWGVTSPAAAGSNLLTLGYGNILMSSSLGWGGAIYDYAANGSGSLVNRHDAGRLWQSMVNIIYPDNVTFVNPTEAGDTYNRGSAVLQASNKTTAPMNVQYTKSAPFGFLGQTNEANLGGTSPDNGNVAVQFNGMTIGKQITLAFNGDNNVAQYVAKVYSNASAPRITGNLPILYLPGNFRQFSTYNPASGAWLAQAVLAGQYNVQSQDYGLTSNCGGIIAENDARTVGVAIYGCKPGTRNGGAFHLAFSNHSPNGNPDPLADDTTALISQITYGDNVSMPAGESSLTTYIVVCKSTAPALAGVACVNSMANLYSQGY